MPFPSDLDALLKMHYEFLRSEVCATCGEFVERFRSPGKREIVLNPMCFMHSAAVWHETTCKKENDDGREETGGLEPAGRDGSRGTGSHRELDTGQNRELPVDRAALLPDGRRDDESPRAKLYTVRDPNRNLIAVGWADGTLVCQFAKGKGYHTGVPEDLFHELRRVPFALRTYQQKIKGKYPYEKIA